MLNKITIDWSVLEIIICNSILYARSSIEYVTKIHFIIFVYCMFCIYYLVLLLLYYLVTNIKQSYIATNLPFFLLLSYLIQKRNTLHIIINMPILRPLQNNLPY